MAKKKVKASPKKKVVNSACCSSSCNGVVGMAKFAALSFGLLLVSAFEGVASWVVGVHWGWFLAATVIFGMLACKKRK